MESSDSILGLSYQSMFDFAAGLFYSTHFLDVRLRSPGDLIGPYVAGAIFIIDME